MSRITVSDHPLNRWLERTGALDVEALRAMLANSLEAAATAAASMSTRRYLIIADGLLYLVEDGTLKTVLPDNTLNDHVKALSGRLLRRK